MIIPDGIAETAITLKDQLFDLRGLSAYSALAVPTLRDYLRNGRNPIPYFKIKGKILIRKSEFDEWLETFRVNRKQDIQAVVDEVMASFKKRQSDQQSEGHGC